MLQGLFRVLQKGGKNFKNKKNKILIIKKLDPVFITEETLHESKLLTSPSSSHRIDKIPCLCCPLQWFFCVYLSPLKYWTINQSSNKINIDQLVTKQNKFIAFYSFQWEMKERSISDELTKNHTHVKKVGHNSVWQAEIDNYGSFFALLPTPFPKIKKIRILKKWKKMLEISFYTFVPKTTIKWGMWSETIFCHLGPVFALLPP